MITVPIKLYSSETWVPTEKLDLSRPQKAPEIDYCCMLKAGPARWVGAGGPGPGARGPEAGPAHNGLCPLLK